MEGTPVQPQYHQITTHKSANHLLHLIITLLTCGLWAPVWFIVGVFGKKEVGTMQGFTATPQQPAPQWQQQHPPPQYGQQAPTQPYGYPPQPPAALPPAPQYPPQNVAWGRPQHEQEQPRTEGADDDR